MKKFRLFLLPLFVASMCITLTSCGGGDDDGFMPPTQENNGGSSGSGDSGYDSGVAPTGTQTINLGLPSGILWANMNVGATAEEGYGQYFAWGETTGYGSDTSDGHFFNWYNYKWGTDTSLKKYCSNSQYGTVDNKTVLELTDDAARAIWGGDWRMPTSEEFQELLDNTTQERTSVNGINGIRLTSKVNGNSIFLPASGYRMDNKTLLYESGAYYWTSSIYMYKFDNTPIDFYASAYGFNATENIYGPAENSRYYGLGIRAVIDKANIQPSPESESTIKSTPLTLEAIADGTITFRNMAAGFVTYKIDDGNEQIIGAGTSKDIIVIAGQKIRFYGNNATYYDQTKASDKYSNISSTCEYYAYGNIMSLVNSSNFATCNTLTAPYTFALLFAENANLRNHPTKSLLLPATTLSEYCYLGMFKKCTSLTIAPILPAKTLTCGCYENMFEECTSLTTAPELPATILAEYCYCDMFWLCYNLTKAPKLPATTLAPYCYEKMFQRCRSLATAPALPATKMEKFCYTNMFALCDNLTQAPELPATTLANNCYASMFEGCTSLTIAPSLPANTLKPYCYMNMFAWCTNLTAAPVLPATSLVDNCYYGMFQGCSKLKYVKCLARYNISDYCYKWLSNVASSGTFVKVSSASWPSGESGIPYSWTTVNN